MPDYDLDAMEKAVEKCDVNIKTFEEAIKRELDTKMEYQRIVRILREKLDAIKVETKQPS